MVLTMLFCSTHVVEILRDHRNRLVLQEAHQDQKHRLVQQCTYRDAVREPLPEDVPPVSNQNIFFHHFLILPIILQWCAFLLLSNRRYALLLYRLPAWKCALEPALPVEVDGCSEHDHECELEEEDAVEYEGFGFVPCLQALCDNIRARIDSEGG